MVWKTVLNNEMEIKWGMPQTWKTTQNLIPVIIFSIQNRFFLLWFFAMYVKKYPIMHSWQPVVTGEMYYCVDFRTASAWVVLTYSRPWTWGPFSSICSNMRAGSAVSEESEITPYFTPEYYLDYYNSHFGCNKQGCLHWPWCHCSYCCRQGTDTVRMGWVY